MRKLVLMLVPALALAGCIKFEGGEHINGAVSVAAGHPAADASTVNGGIDLAANAAAKKIETVNGSINLGARAVADSAETVNGAITLGAGARVGGNVETVNGAITLHKGAEVAGNLENVNGRFDLEAAHVGGGIETFNGDISVGADSRVDGGIAVRKSKGFSISFTKDVPKVVIGPGAVVKGPLEFEREVTLYVSDRATIGPVTGASPIAFPGDLPPG
ncbi:MAG: hypothetical protein AB7P31_10660 [Steroidobacteraceae bacterium]